MLRTRVLNTEFPWWFNNLSWKTINIIYYIDLSNDQNFGITGQIGFSWVVHTVDKFDVGLAIHFFFYLLKLDFHNYQPKRRGCYFGLMIPTFHFHCKKHFQVCSVHDDSDTSQYYSMLSFSLEVTSQCSCGVNFQSVF